MDVAPVKHDRMVTDVQRLFRAVKTKASANVIPNPMAIEGVPRRLVCVRGTDRVVVDLN